MSSYNALYPPNVGAQSAESIIALTCDSNAYPTISDNLNFCCQAVNQAA